MIKTDTNSFSKDEVKMQEEYLNKINQTITRDISVINEQLTVEIEQHKQTREALKKRLEFEKLISDFSARFVNIHPDQVDMEIEHALKHIYEFFECDRSGLLEVLPDKAAWKITHVAAAEDTPGVPVGTELPAAIYPWTYEKLTKKHEIISFSRVDDMPAEANVDKQSRIEWGIRSALSIPIISNGPIDHVIVLNSIKNECVWLEEFFPKLQLFGEIFVNALERKRNRLELEEQLRFETLLVKISGRFVNMPADQVDDEIEDAQRQVCECLGLDLSALWLWSMETPRTLKISHLYRPLGGQPLPEPMYAHEYFPWCQEQLEAGRIIAVPSVEDLPVEAARDQEVWRHFGVKTSLTLPLSPWGEQPIGALSFNTMQQERAWPEPLINRLQLVAQVLINALVRKQTETVLRESEARLSLTTTAVGAGLWIMDVDTRKVWVSPKSRELFNFTPDEEIYYESYFRVIHPDDRDRVSQDLQQALQSGEHLHCDYRIVLPDGHIRWIRARGQSFQKSTGEPERILGLSLDITEHKQMELKHNWSKTLLDTLINSTSDLIWSVDSDQFGLLTFNSGLYEYFLQERGIHIEAGMRPEDLLPTEEYAQKWRTFYQRTLEEGSFTAEYLVSAGSRTLRLNLNILKIEDRVFGISVFGQDVTKIKGMENRLREQLEEINKLKLQLEEENIYLREEIKIDHGFEKIVGESNVLQYTLFRAKQVATTNATVLILGETGTGKGMVAHAIHEMSARNGKPIITINCAAIPANLIESELFGREKGAYTGAHARQSGRFEIANGGTIFLDEIGEMPLELQSKLLRVLQDGEFEKLGSPRTIKVDVRVIAATSRDLKVDVRNGRFREDLFYRLSVFPVSIPPLRTRSGDIPQLVNHFVDKYARQFGRQIESVSKSTMQSLQNYQWPGNVRELEHIIERSIITSPGSVLRLADRLDSEGADDGECSLKDLETVEREHIIKVLQKTRWKVDGKGGAAVTLGLNPSTLRFRIKKLGIIQP